jgi:hypothetical protein
VAAYLDELRSALASHDAVLGSQRLTELEQKISPSLAAPGVPATPGSVTGDSALAGLGSAYSTSVAMGAAGLFITDGAITVTNGSSTVVIDGTSDMFKIQATGTQQVAFPSGTWTSADTVTTLTGLGSGYTLVPAVHWNSGQYTSYRVADRMFVVAGGDGRIAMQIWSFARIVTGYVTMTLVAANETTDYYGSLDAVCRYYVLKEAGI